MGASNFVHISVNKVKKETDKAFLFVLDEGEMWFPKSQIATPKDYKEGDIDIEVAVTEWIANEKGLEGYD